MGIIDLFLHNFIIKNFLYTQIHSMVLSVVNNNFKLFSKRRNQQSAHLSAHIFPY